LEEVEVRFSSVVEAVLSDTGSFNEEWQPNNLAHINMTCVRTKYTSQNTNAKQGEKEQQHGIREGKTRLGSR
jgi:hypothetical protein